MAGPHTFAVDPSSVLKNAPLFSCVCGEELVKGLSIRGWQDGLSTF